MRRSTVLVHGQPAAILAEIERNRSYRLTYDEQYAGPPISQALPTSRRIYEFAPFPPFFDGVLPEGLQLEALLRQHEIDADDHLGQLLAVGRDLVGAVTVEPIRDADEP